MKKVKLILLTIAFLIAVSIGASAAEINLPDIISDHMLLQQGEPIILWGTAQRGEDVEIKVTADGTVYAETVVTAGADGNFRAELDAMKPGGPYELTFTCGSSSVTVMDVLIGELWIQSGQSNMVMPVRNTVAFSEAMIPEETIDKIRLFYNTYDNKMDERNTNLKGEWRIADREAVEYYSAIGFCALNTIYDELQIPVGGICCAVSGATMLSYTGPEEKGGIGGQRYNSKIAPLTDLNVRGVMWCQGSGDRDNVNFASDFAKLIASWRNDREEPDMPFIYVTAPPAPMKYYASWLKDYIMEDYSLVRMGQVDAYYITENTAYCVCTDGKPNEGEDPLHPRDKQNAGIRLGLAALGTVYGTTDKWSGPMYKSAAANGNSVDITFSYAYDGLKTTDGKPPRCFLVAEKENEFHVPDAEIIDSHTIRLTCDEIDEIRYVSYCIEKHLWPYESVEDAVIDTYFDVNVVNSEGLPLSMFYQQVTDVRPEKEFGNFVIIPEVHYTGLKYSYEDEARTNPFTDVRRSDIYYDSVLQVYHSGIMNGTGEGVFAPGSEFSLAMLVTVLHRIDIAEKGQTASQTGDTWYSDAVRWASETGLCTLTDDENLMKPVTNAQMADILYAYLQPGSDEEVAPMEWTVRNFIMESGLKEDAPVSRSQAAVTFVQLIKK